MQVNFTKNNKEYQILIDDEDYDKIKDLKLTILVQNRYHEYVIDSTTRKRLYKFIVNCKANQICIHKNNNHFDFRKDNLFITTKKELIELVKTGKIRQRFDELDRIYYEF